MSKDDKSRMRWGIPLKTKDEVAEALQMVIRDVANPEGISIEKVHCDGGREFLESSNRCADRTELPSKPTRRISPKGMPSLSVGLVPLSVLRAASSWALLT